MRQIKTHKPTSKVYDVSIQIPHLLMMNGIVDCPDGEMCFPAHSVRGALRYAFESLEKHEIDTTIITSLFGYPQKQADLLIGDFSFNYTCKEQKDLMRRGSDSEIFRSSLYFDVVLIGQIALKKGYKIPLPYLVFLITKSFEQTKLGNDRMGEYGAVKKCSISSTDFENSMDSIMSVRNTACNSFIKVIGENPELVENLEWREMEHLFKHILYELGFDVELTPSAKDGGKDITVSYVNGLGVSETLYVEIKHWRTPVGVGPIKKILDVSIKDKASKAWLFSSSGFTTSAHDKYDSLVGLKDITTMHNLIRQLDGSNTYKTLEKIIYGV